MERRFVCRNDSPFEVLLALSRTDINASLVPSCVLLSSVCQFVENKLDIGTGVEAISGTMTSTRVRSTKKTGK